MREKNENPGLFVSRMIRQSIVIIAIGIIGGLLFNVLRTKPLPLVGDWSSFVCQSSETGEKNLISPKDAEKLSEARQALFLDARSPADYEIGHIRGAANLPLSEFDKYFRQIIPDLPQDKTIITYCDGSQSCQSSKELAKALTTMGIRNVRVLAGGWRADGKNALPAEMSPESWSPGMGNK